jgi:hypothetical protein
MELDDWDIMPTRSVGKGTCTVEEIFKVKSALAVCLPVHGRAEIVLAPIPRLIYSFSG